MPLTPYKIEQIVLPVSDREYNDTVIKQKATFVNLSHVQSATGSYVRIEVCVSMYANDNGNYGTKLEGKGFAPYSISLGADNDTLVEVSTGEIVKVRTNESEAEWKSIADLHEKDVMFQADFFIMLRDTQPISIGGLIRQHIANADTLGRFA